MKSDEPLLEVRFYSSRQITRYSLVAVSIMAERFIPLLLLLAFAARVEGSCNNPVDIDTWETSGICLDSSDDMADCILSTTLFLPDAVRCSQ